MVTDVLLHGFCFGNSNSAELLEPAQRFPLVLSIDRVHHEKPLGHAAFVPAVIFSFLQLTVVERPGFLAEMDFLVLELALVGVGDEDFADSVLFLL